MNSVELANFFKALSEPVRLRLLALLLAKEELCVCDLVDALALPQSVVSRHLAYLRNAGVVSATRRGVWMYYTIQATPSCVSRTLAIVADSHELKSELGADLARLSQNRSCA